MKTFTKNLSNSEHSGNCELLRVLQPPKGQSRCDVYSAINRPSSQHRLPAFMILVLLTGRSRSTDKCYCFYSCLQRHLVEYDNFSQYCCVLKAGEQDDENL